jgi:hypothetical protein
MPTDNTYDRILAYLKGLLSPRQRHNLEKDMMQDVFEEEAFEGLSGLSGSELESDMELLQKRLDARIKPVSKRNLIPYFRLAAAVALLIGAGSIIYFIFRTPGADLLTEEHKIEQPALHSVPPPNSVQIESDNEKPEKSGPEKKPDSKMQIVQEPPENLSESNEEITYQKAAASAEKKEFKEPEIPEPAKLEKSMVRMKSADNSLKPRKIYSGTVVDNSGEILPGVIVNEKGTSNTTVTDKNGNFNLPLQDTNSLLALNYIGYETVELEASEKPKDKIVMEEDVTALNEVVVVGYATKTRSSVTGSVATVRVDEESPSQTNQPVITKPIPPGGSLKAFKRWVNDRLDYTAYKDFPGKHKITVEITVHTDGTISNIRVNKNTPGVIAADLKKVISQSSLWNAGLKDDRPVETDVVIRFIITVE